MGGRGVAGGLVSGTKLEYGGRSMSIFKFLNQDDIRRANDASITDMGDIIKRMFLSNSKEINNFELSSQEKKDAIDEMAKLSTAALKASAAAVNPYVSGPARLTQGQRSGKMCIRDSVKDGHYWDTWDSGQEIPIYYWEK